MALPQWNSAKPLAGLRRTGTTHEKKLSMGQKLHIAEFMGSNVSPIFSAHLHLESQHTGSNQGCRFISILARWSKKARMSKYLGS